MNIFLKPATARWDYDIDFSPWLPDGDTVLRVQVKVIPAESMVSCPLAEIAPGALGVKVWLVDGLPGKTARVIVTVWSAQGRIDPYEFQVRVT